MQTKCVLQKASEFEAMEELFVSNVSVHNASTEILQRDF